jgi:hypothetical protein
MEGPFGNGAPLQKESGPYLTARFRALNSKNLKFRRYDYGHLNMKKYSMSGFCNSELWMNTIGLVISNTNYMNKLRRGRTDRFQRNEQPKEATTKKKKEIHLLQWLDSFFTLLMSRSGCGI